MESPTTPPPKLFLFTDGSVNTKSKVGFGAYLAISEDDLDGDIQAEHVVLKQFPATSSTKLEIETLLWAIESVKEKAPALIIYTDSQNIVQLPERRERLEKNLFRSKKGKLLNNHELYKAFFAAIDSTPCTILKIKGHKSYKDHQRLDRLFSHVDRASRNATRDLANKTSKSEGLLFE